ncbi:MAG: pyridoxamine kinase [Lachnospiraceae bacterium]|nr:pyridoxamine kinase [Lachnospiraceae bacterium]
MKVSYQVFLRKVKTMKKVALINDLSGFGKCSLTAAIPVISALGVSCHPLTTAVLTAQSGYEHFYCKDMTDMMPEYIDAWKKNEVSFDGIYSGYMTGPAQIDYVNRFLDEFLNEDTFLLVDPVMGDNGECYKMFTEEHLDKMRLLIKRANLITPNLTESCMLAGADYGKLLEIEDKDKLFEQIEYIAETIKKNANDNLEIIITGIRVKKDDSTYIYNFALTNEGNYKVCTASIDKSFSGTGDLFASAVCGLKMNGHSTKNAMELAARFIFKSIADTIGENLPGTYGINFEKHLGYLMKEGM